MSKEKPTYEELEARLTEAEAVIEALRSQQVDAIVGEERVALVHLKELEEALRDSRHMLQTVLDSISVAVFWKDRDSIYLGGNRTWLEAVGLESSEEVVGKNDYDLPWKKKQADSFREDDRRVMESGIPEYDIIEPYLRADGTHAWAKTNKVPLRDTEGNVVGVLGTYEDTTERKRAEEALRESEESFRALAENANDGILITTGDGRHVYANERTAEITGYSVSELLKTYVKDLVQPDEFNKVSERFRKRIAGEPVPQQYETAFIRKDGGVVPIELTAAQTLWQGQNAVMIIFRDITARKRAEEALKQRAAQLALLNDIGGKIAAVLELDSLLERAARLVQESFGYHHVGLFTVDRERDELVMKTRAGDFAHLYPPDHRLKLGQGVVGWAGRHGETLLANDVDTEPRYVNLYPDLVPTRSELCVPIRVGEEIVGVLDVQSPQLNAFDESDAMVMETLADQIAVAIGNVRLHGALKELKEFNEGIVQNVTEGIVVTDVEGRLTFANPAMATMVDHAPEELLGQHWAVIVSPDYQHLVQAADERRARGQADRYDLELLRKDGTRLPVLVSGSPRFDDGRFVGTLAIFADISERVRAEHTLRQRTAQLEALRQVGLELTTQLDPNALLRSIVSRAVELLGGSGGGIDLYRPDRDLLEWAASAAVNLTLSGTAPHRGEGLVGRVWETGEPLIVDDYQHWEGRAAIFEDYSFTAIVGVPVRWGDDFLGVLVVVSNTPRAFAPTDAELLSLFATQAAITIQNARLFEMERKRTAQLAAVAQVAEQITAILSLDDLLRETVELIVEAFGHYHVAIMLLDAEANELVFEVSAGAHADQTLAGFRQKVKEGMIGWAAHLGQTLLANDVTQEPRYITAYLTETRSELDVPLKHHDRVIGVLDLQSKELNAFSQHDVLAMEALAGHIAAAVENARLYEQARQDAETRSVLLREVNHRVKNNLTAIAGLLYAERRHAGVENHAVYQSIMQELVNRVQGLATVHSLLSASEWAPVPLSELATQIIRSSLQMLPRGKCVSVDVTPSPVRVTSDQAHDLALVINELATNTIKHATQEHDTVHIAVRIRLDDDSAARTVLFEFRDDGPGYPADVLRLERLSVGFDLIQNIVHSSLRGELTLHNDRGAVAEIRFAAQV
jgi:PAS domain S-box-containing protein